MPRRKIALLCTLSPDAVDGIRDYTVHLAQGLNQFENCETHLFMYDGKGAWQAGTCDDLGLHECGPRVRSDEIPASVAAYDAVVLQYNPFMYGRWGFAPWLPLMYARMRRRLKGRLALTVHEPYVSAVNWRWFLMGLWQRTQLGAIAANADIAFITIEKWAQKLQAVSFRHRGVHLPVGSNLPDMSHLRLSARREMGLTDHTLVFATFGQNHPSHLRDYVVAAANAVAEHKPVALLNLGAGAPDPKGLDCRIASWSPGWLPAVEVARKLAAADIFVGAFSDGVSTRRTSLMAALQHGLAVAGTHGTSTDRILRESTDALRLVAVTDRQRFVQSVEDLALVADERERLRMGARRLYRRCFDWPVVVRGLVAALGLGNTIVSPDTSLTGPLLPL